MKVKLLNAIFALAAALATANANSSNPLPKSDAPAKSENIAGKAVETMDARNYTYVLVDTGLKKLWAVAPHFVVKPGDAIVAVAPAMMVNYRSKTLDRTFDAIFFTSEVLVNGARATPTAPSAVLPDGHVPLGRASGAVPAELRDIKRADDGHTVAEIYAQQAKLSGRKITVRGRVVKFNGTIMGRNWVHIQDGTGTEATNDLTVTTADSAKVGDLVLVTGMFATDRDFGAGYKFRVILEDARLAVEKP